MNAILATAERTGKGSAADNYIIARHLFAYENVRNKLGNLVIELGSGTCYGMNNLSQNCVSYIGVDKYFPPGLQLQSGCSLFKSKLPDLRNIGTNSYDTVICFQVIEHIEEDTSLCDEMYRILKPGGRLFLTTPNKNMSLTRNPYHVREYNCTTMDKLIGSRFSKYTVQGIYGDSTVMEYYNINRAQIEKITKWDLFNLQYRLPSWILQIPYSIANNINRHLLFKTDTNLTNSLHYSNFFLGDASPTCLDFFVTAEKVSDRC
jgi:SAM-dependent methyltransferase